MHENVSTNNNGSILRDFAADPLSLVQPRQVVRLRVVISHFGVRSVNHLLDQGPSYTVAFGAKRHGTLLKMR